MAACEKTIEQCFRMSTVFKQGSTTDSSGIEWRQCKDAAYFVFVCSTNCSWVILCSARTTGAVQVAVRIFAHFAVTKFAEDAFKDF